MAILIHCLSKKSGAIQTPRSGKKIGEMIRKSAESHIMPVIQASFFDGKYNGILSFATFLYVSHEGKVSVYVIVC